MTDEIRDYFVSCHNDFAENRLDNTLFDFERMRKLCESPIEERLLAAMMNDLMVLDGQAHTTVRKQFDVTEYKYRETLIVPQYEAGRYRLDFAVFWYREKCGLLKLAVECDGHDFHEKTKEQAKRDKSRDRYLMAEGWMTARFTGSEIFNDADECAMEVGNIMFEQWVRRVAPEARSYP